MLKSNSAVRKAIHVVGHPSAPIGMGEHARSVFKALRAAGEDVRLVDIFGPTSLADELLVDSYAEHLSPLLGDGVNIFCINADEVDLALRTLKDRNLFTPISKNVIYPAWELSRYPTEWGEVLDGFDEVWAPSKFVADALTPATKSPVFHMPLACEIGQRGLVSRRHFGLPDSSYCFLFAFDFLSYIERKNPYGVLEAFELALSKRPNSDARLVIKLNNADVKPADFNKFKKFFEKIKDRVILIDGTLSDLEMKSLVWLCDCFVSLHRSEGYGRGISEAMAIGKPTITTGYSGNLDFCNKHTSFLVPFELIAVGVGQYPHWQKQVWADADVEAASLIMVKLIDKPELGLEKGSKAREVMAADFSFLRRGLDYAQRVKDTVNT